MSRFDASALDAEAQQSRQARAAHTLAMPPPPAPTPAPASSPSPPPHNPLVHELEQMGFARERVLNALQLAQGDAETALNILMSNSDLDMKQSHSAHHQPSARGDSGGGGSCYQQ